MVRSLRFPSQTTKNILMLLFLLSGSFALPAPAHAASTITVATIVDNLDDADGLCTLREAITNANNDAQTYNDCVSGSGNDTIQFNDALGTATISLGSTLPNIADADGLTINGGGDITISGNDLYRIFIDHSVLTLDGITLTHGQCTSCVGGGVYSSGGVLTVRNSTFSHNKGSIYVYEGLLTVENSNFSNNNDVFGAAIQASSNDASNSTTTITNSTFSENTSTSGGGGSSVMTDGNTTITNSTFTNNSNGSGNIYNSGNLTITGSIFTNNVASNNAGGAIFNNNSGFLLTVNNSVFSGNSAPNGYGAGIASFEGAVLITNSTFDGNAATNGYGGAIYNYANSTLTVANSTFYNNTADYGAGVFNADNGTATVVNSTFSNNTGNGAGIYNYPLGVLHLKNTILANSIGGEDCLNVSGNVIATNTNNLIETNGPSGNQCGTPMLSGDPALGALTGAPAYFPLISDSPAIHAGDDTVCAAAPVHNTSQNGQPRPQGAHCDIGSFEKTNIFADVPFSYWANSFIELLYGAGITGGCSVTPLNYCPDNLVTRDQMAVFLERGIHGASFSPPNVVPTFNDTAGNFAEDWIEALKNDGITGGCGTNIYCPSQGVTRAQMAIFLERAMHGASFTPPNVSPTFSDTAGHFAEDWIEALKNDGITSGCGTGIYCPDAIVTRAQMAVFLVKAFGLP